MWPEVSLDQLGYVSRGRSRHRPRNDPSLYDGPYPFIQTAEVKAANLRICSHSQTYSEKGFEQSRLWPENTLCITIAANIADTALLSYPACFPDSIIGFVADESKCDVRYVKYYFNIVQEHMRMVSHGATQDNLSQDKLLRFGIPCPPLETQHAISETLAAYDDLIETNRRRIVLLEESARLLYREWFVNLRFPGYEQSKVVDGLPVGWSRQPLSALIEESPKTPFEKDKIYPFVPMQSLSESSMVIGAREEREISGGAKFHNLDTLLARITPCLENGKTGFVQFLSDELPVASGSTEFIVMRSKSVSPYWVYCLAREDSFRDHAIRSMAGADGRQRVKTKCFDTYMTLQPPASILQEFDAIMEPLFNEVEILARQNVRLQDARDRLLPKLMSGEIQV